VRFYLPGHSGLFHFANADDEIDHSCLGRSYPFRPMHTVSWALATYESLFGEGVAVGGESSAIMGTEPSIGLLALARAVR
jgi:hypothetical protein